MPIEGGKADFIFLGFKITADDGCSDESKTLKNLYRVFKSRDITFLTKVLIVKSAFFPVVMHTQKQLLNGHASKIQIFDPLGSYQW